MVQFASFQFVFEPPKRYCLNFKVLAHKFGLRVVEQKIKDGDGFYCTVPTVFCHDVIGNQFVQVDSFFFIEMRHELESGWIFVATTNVSRSFQNTIWINALHSTSRIS